jgi:hypothetical protein
MPEKVRSGKNRKGILTEDEQDEQGFFLFILFLYYLPSLVCKILNLI